MHIRPAVAGDLAAIAAIYDHYVLNGFASFDEAPRPAEAWGDWFAAFDVAGPHRLLVAEEGHDVVGFASSKPYREHAAFAEPVELGISLAPEHRGQGLGTQLYARLIEDLRSEQLHRAVAGIALPNEASVRLHRRFGFQEVGVFDEYAKKGGEYLSSVWMQRPLP